MRSHVDGTSNARFEHLRAKIINVFCKTEISYFIDALVDEDIGRFKISMDYFLSDEFCESAEYLPHNFEYLLFFEFFTFHEFFEISIFTKLGDDIQTILGAEYILELHDIGVIKTF